MRRAFRWRTTLFSVLLRLPHIGNWGLRDYGVDGQLGLEKTPEEYVAKMAEVFREVRRVLRRDGTLWLNLGDSYTSGGRKERDPGQSKIHPAFEGNNFADGLRPDTPPGLKPKDLVGIPWRVAFALQADGWWLRQDIIWSKPNPMPESVTDRCTKSHEYLFLLTKSASYYCDMEAVKEPSTGQNGSAANFARATKESLSPGQSATSHRLEREATSDNGFRNRRSVWNIATQPYKGAHFATFPEKLVEPCILAGTSERGACSQCGAPWERVVERGLTQHDGETASAYSPGTTANRLALLHQAARERGEEYRNEAKTTGWKPACSCGADTKPCIVLDPFCGSGTVGVVAGNLGRKFVGLDINTKYLNLAQDRLMGVQPPIPFEQYRGDLVDSLVEAVEKAERK